MRLELQEKKLNDLIKNIGTVQDDELKAHLARYVCILISGYVENYIKEMVAIYHDKSCTKETARYINSKMRNLTNLDDDKIITFLDSFNTEWVDKYKNGRSDKMQAAFNSVYAQRNKIAHGNANNSNVSYNSIKVDFESVKEGLVILSKIICK